MPSKRVVPKKLRVPEWYLSDFMMNRALEAVVRQIKKVDRRHDIPYLAGYSKNGKTIYIDRNMPKVFPFRGAGSGSIVFSYCTRRWKRP